MQSSIPGIPRPEGANYEQEIENKGELSDILEQHVKDTLPHAEGNNASVRQMSGTLFGSENSEVPRADPPLEVARISLTPGTIKVLIGPNGAGKTTLYDAIMELDGACFNVGDGRGAIVYGKPVHFRENGVLRISRLNQEEMLAAIADYTAAEVIDQFANESKKEFPVDWDNADWQDPDTADRLQSNEDIVVRLATLRNQVTGLFELEDFLGTKVRNLSGGERTKLALVMALASEPDVILLDEPTNHLDLRSIAKLIGLFKHYKKAGVAILCVSHVDWFLETAGIDGTIEITWNKSGRKLEESNAPYSRHIVNRSREWVPIVSGDIDWLQRDYHYKQGSELFSAPQKFTIPDSPLAEIALPSISGGDLYLMSGDNGTGKTKIMETLMWNQQNELPKKAKGTQIAYLPQFWPDEVVEGNLGEFFEWVRGTTTPHEKGSALFADQPAVNLFLKQAKELKFGNQSRIGEGWLSRPFATFSGGEQRILWFLAVSCLRNVDMLMLDEPTNHMDAHLQKVITRAIKNFPGAILLSTHDLNLTRELSRNGGNIKGTQRFTKHVILSKRRGKTSVEVSQESPAEYADRNIANAYKEAQKIKIS